MVKQIERALMLKAAYIYIYIKFLWLYYNLIDVEGKEASSVGKENMMRCRRRW